MPAWPARPPARAARPSALGPVVPLEDRLVPATAFALLPNNSLAEFSTDNPAAALAPVAVTGLAAGEQLVGIDFRPQNGVLYGLATSAVAGGSAVRLVAISVQTGVATPLTAAPVTFTDAGGAAVPVTGTAFGFDFNPAVDRVRVTTDSGLNFRMNPNTGAIVDGDGVAGNPVVPDTAVNPAAVAVSGSAYTSNSPNATGSTPVTTLYTLDATNNQLLIQSNPNGGTQTAVGFVTLNGATLDFTAANGFDIPAGVAAAANNAGATGRAFASLTVAGATRLYGIELSTGVATDLGPLPAGATGLAVQTEQPGTGAAGTPLVALAPTAGGPVLTRFLSGTPGGAGTPAAVTGVAAAETVVGAAFRPATGQLYALGVNAAADTATLYVVDPQTGAATAVGTPGGIAFTADGTAVVDLPAAGGYGFDFNPTVDRIRVVTGTGLNFRLNPITGAAVDGDNGGAAGSVAGTNPDAAVNGAATGLVAVAYTNGFAGAAATTLYAVDAAGRLLIQSNPNGGTTTAVAPVTVNGSAVAFTGPVGFDIPANVRAAASNAAVPSGFGFLTLTTAAGPTLYRVDLTTGAATSLGAVANAPASGLVGLTSAQTPVGAVGFAAATATFAENAGTGTLTLTRTGGTSGPFTVTATFAGSATPTPVTFADGQTTAILTFPITDNTTDNPDVTVVVTLSAPTNGAVLGAQTTTTVTITDDDPAPAGAVGFSAPTFTVSERGPTATLTLTRTGGSAGAVSVTLRATGGTATAGADFGTVPATVTFADGQTTATVQIPITDDALVEGDETVVFTLTDPTGGASLASQGTATLTITDNDTATGPFGGVRFASSAVTVAEGGGSVSITLVRSDASTAPFQVTVTGTGGTASPGVDYGFVLGVVTFAQGQTTATLTVPIIQDVLPEANETFVVTLSNPTDGATLGTPASTTVTIIDDDTAAAARPFLIGGPSGGAARLLIAPNGVFSLGGNVTIPGLTTNARVAVADVNGDGTPDTIAGAGPGGASLLVVVDGKTGAVLSAFSVFEAAFTGGVYVAAGDVDGDGRADVVVTPDLGGGPVVALYSGAKLAQGLTGDAAQTVRFFGIEDPAFRGGARAALGDMTGDGKADIAVSAGFLGGPRLALFDGSTVAFGTTAPRKLVADFFAFEDTLRNGSFVALGDITGDGRADLVVGGGPGGGPRVRVFDGKALLAAPAFQRLDEVPSAQRANFFAADPNLRGGVRVAAHDATGDGVSELVVGSGEGEASRVRLFRPANLLTNANPTPDAEFDPFSQTLANGVFVG